MLFNCNTGYLLVGPTSLPCENGTIFGQVPRCIGTIQKTALHVNIYNVNFVVVCPRPDIQENVRVKGIGNQQLFPVNHSITYRCHFGYEMPQGAIAIDSTCQSTKRWYNPTPSCFRERSLSFYLIGFVGVLYLYLSIVGSRLLLKMECTIW